MDSDTIFAPATAGLPAGVCLLRLSGPSTKDALAALGISLPAPRVASLRKVYVNGEQIDHALTLWFPTPASFTGEDVAELHLHGSRAVLSAVMEALTRQGLRLAEPGEFTRRAYLNGRMDLTEAEGLLDLIDAETEAQRRQALQALTGDTGRRFEQLRADIIALLAHVEAYIDFPDEDIPADVLAGVQQKARMVAEDIRAALATRARGERIREGISVVILGAPNAGKSSLINALAKRDVAIVSHVAGTTRDVIEAHVNIGGYAVVLVDTAGLRDSADPIEQEGIRRARQRAESADLKLILFDGLSAPDPASLALLDASALPVISKADALASVPDAIAGHPAIAVSATNGDGMEALLDALQARLSGLVCGGTALVTRARHAEALEAALSHLERFLKGGPIELISEELRLSARAVGKITGKIAVDELLDRIFRDFCIGK